MTERGRLPGGIRRVAYESADERVVLEIDATMSTYDGHRRIFAMRMTPDAARYLARVIERCADAASRVVLDVTATETGKDNSDG